MSSRREQAGQASNRMHCCGVLSRDPGAPEPIKGAVFEVQVDELDLSLEHADRQSIGIQALDELPKRGVQNTCDNRLEHGAPAAQPRPHPPCTTLNGSQ